MKGEAMRGLTAITAANGWVITFSGLSIVFVGLCVLAAFLTYLERLLAWWDMLSAKLKTSWHPAEIQETQPTARIPLEKASAPAPLPREIYLKHEALEVYQAFQLLSQRKAPAFSLPKLLEQAEKRGVHRPHYHMNQFLLLGLFEELSGEDRGFYRWAKGVVVRPKETPPSAS
ncbi:MAG: hypothetical protein ACUVSA_08615 [Desulfosoma sp.]|uniref:hypothetical protein n=1 Tax=Desulfosoma sp. TaxID=2603217 RepID=UPI00404A101E